MVNNNVFTSENIFYMTFFVTLFVGTNLEILATLWS